MTTQNIAFNQSNQRRKQEQNLRRRPTKLCAALVTLLVVTACGARSSSSQSVGGESHFLEVCSNADCESGLECLDGACSQECDSNEQCGELHESSTCIDRATEGPRCGVECSEAAGCAGLGSDFECHLGTCRSVALSPPPPSDTTDTPCTAGDYRCTDQALQLCDEGTWSTEEICDDDRVCSAEVGACVCRAGVYSCVADSLLVCDGDGSWVIVDECEEGFCSSESGTCLACQPGEEYYCNGSVLLECSDDGTEFTPVKDCAEEGLLCDTTVIADDCFECRSTDRRCVGDLLATCMGNSFSNGGTNCTIPPHCIESDAEGNDYCAQCSVPGEEACDADNQRTRCSDEYLWETLEQCVSGCVMDGSTSSCQ